MNNGESDNSINSEPIPTLFEWAGGIKPFERLTAEMYRRVPDDPILGPVFSGMSAEHAQHVGHFIAEVCGGPPTYSGRGGSHAGMIRKHMHRDLREEQRRRWFDLMIDCADAVGLPDDPEFRAAFVAYLEWGSRVAMLNSRPETADPGDGMPMPQWGWGEPKGPYTE